MSKASYHHGALREALTAAGLAAVEKAGPDALTLRGLAQAIGVSHTAAYRHFADRRELLVAIAARGMRELTDAFDQALAAAPTPVAGLRAVTETYFAFAEARPGMYRAMFEMDLLVEPVPAELSLPAGDAYRVFWRAIAAADPRLDMRTVRLRAVTLFSILHGYVALRRAGRLKPFMIEGLGRNEIDEAMVKLVLAAALEVN